MQVKIYAQYFVNIEDKFKKMCFKSHFSVFSGLQKHGNPSHAPFGVFVMFAESSLNAKWGTFCR